MSKGKSQGKWYYWLTILTMGLFAWVPFLHAGSVLNDAKVKRQAIPYGAAALALGLIAGVLPEQELDQSASSSSDPASTLVGLGALTLIIVACIQLSRLRRRVYALHDPHARPPSASELAVAEVVADRQRRADARAVVERDPMLARDLHIGRPDRRGGYDDGGLVDLNTATPDVLMTVAGLSGEVAMKLVAIRESFPDGFDFVDEAIAYVQMSEGEERQLRERAIVVPL